MADKKISGWKRQIASLTQQIHQRAEQQRELKRRIAEMNEAISILRQAHSSAQSLAGTVKGMKFNDTWTGRARRELDTDRGVLKQQASSYQHEIWNCIVAADLKRTALWAQYDALGELIGKAEDSIRGLNKNISKRQSNLAAAKNSSKRK